MRIKFAPLLVISVGVLLRLLPHPPNIAPITAIALFGGVYLHKRFAFIIPLSALLISDFFLGFYGITMIFVYGSFVLVGLIGIWLKGKERTATVVGAALGSSFVFYVVTNFGVWISTDMYANNFQGLLDSYIMALPFYRNTLIGDLAYTVGFFTAYETIRSLSKHRLPANIYNLAF